jgi:hypothetical protein
MKANLYSVLAIACGVFVLLGIGPNELQTLVVILGVGLAVKATLRNEMKTLSAAGMTLCFSWLILEKVGNSRMWEFDANAISASIDYLADTLFNALNR